MIAEALIASALAGTPGSSGVGIGGVPVCLTRPALPGRTYDLGKVYVTNTGSGGEDITMSVQADPVRGDRPVDPSWVQVSYPSLLGIIPRHSVPVGPGGFAYLAVTLHVPAAAQPGTYAAGLLAETAGQGSPHDGAQAALGAGAATALRFSVSTPAPKCAPYGPPPGETYATPMPYTSPTAGTGPVSAPSGQYAPASPAASQGSAGSGGKTAGVVLIGIVALCALGLLRRRSA